MNVKHRHLYVPEGMNPPDELRDAACFVCHRIYVGRALWSSDDRHGRSSSYTNLKAAYLREFVPQYRKALDWLLANGWVETDRKYVVGQKSLGYRWRAHTKAVRVQASMALSVRMNERSRRTFKHYTKAQKHLIRWLPRFQIDREGAAASVRQLSSGKEQSVLTDAEFQSAVLATVDLIADKECDVSVCHFGRFHSPFTRLLKELRRFVSFEGQPLVNIDIANSQPLILATLLPQRPAGSLSPPSSVCLALPNGSPTRSLAANDPTIPIRSLHDVEQQAEDAEIPLKKSVFGNTSKCPESDLEQYRSLCEAGQFYEHLMELAGYTNRAEFKDHFYERVIYGTGKRDYELTKVFRLNFPSVWNVIQRAKRKDYRHLVQNMQRAESRVLIDGVCFRLAEEHPEVPVITIHDSIMTTPPNVETVKAIMAEEFAKLDLYPTLREESYEQSAHHHGGTEAKAEVV